MAATEGDGFPWYLKAMFVLVGALIVFIVVVDALELLGAL